MPKFAIITLALFIASLTAVAQDSPPPSTAQEHPRHGQMHGDRAEQRLKRLSRKLSLTADQKEKVRPILQDEEKQLTDLDKDTSLTPQQKHRKTREIRMASRSQIDGLLTDEQKAKLPAPHSGGRRHQPSAPSGSTPAPPQN